ncbi:MAG: Pycsar system effector family protein [Ferruginibacter sp.]
MPGYSNIYKKTEDHVTELFHKHHPHHLVLHNLQHTEGVVKRVNEIAGHYKLSEEDLLSVYVAAWFHDVGYLFTSPENHEEKGADMMKEFLQGFKLPEDIVSKAFSCIMATKFPRDPQNLPEEILCDADTYQFGNKKDFKATNFRAFEEFKQQGNIGLNRKEFDEATLKLLTDHRYYTSYCRDLLSEEKKEIMKNTKKQIKSGHKYKEDESEEITEKDGTTKGMQTMLRLASSNHIQLSEMADSKANILISVNAIIISVILSVLLRKLQTDPYLTVPTIIFLFFSVLTIVIAILATRPKVNTGRFEDADVVNKKTNLLFFGNFHKMTQTEYETAMRTMMKDADYLYSSMIQDIFHLGQVLGKKYRLIRIAYNVFMVGIIVSVLAFSVASVFVPHGSEQVIKNSTGSPF